MRVIKGLVLDFRGQSPVHRGARARWTIWRKENQPSKAYTKSGWYSSAGGPPMARTPGRGKSNHGQVLRRVGLNVPTEIGRQRRQKGDRPFAPADISLEQARWNREITVEGTYNTGVRFKATLAQLVRKKVLSQTESRALLAKFVIRSSDTSDLERAEVTGIDRSTYSRAWRRAWEKFTDHADPLLVYLISHLIFADEE